jgi:hypothetical protein
MDEEKVRAYTAFALIYVSHWPVVLNTVFLLYFLRGEAAELTTFMMAAAAAVSLAAWLLAFHVAVKWRD